MKLDEAIQHAREKAQKHRQTEKKYIEIHRSENDESLFKEQLEDCIGCAGEHEQLAEWLEELKEYKGLEEKGLLLKLPFDVNSEVFIVSKQFILERNCMEYEVKKLKVRDFNYNFLHNFTIVCEERIGDSICQRHLFNTDKVFLTKEEAEQELKRLESAENE